MAYIRGSPQEPRSSEEASEEEAESDEALARRLQAEEAQGRRPQVARFKLMDRVEARYKDPELRGGTWSREYYAATVVDVHPPKTQKRPHEYMIHWDDGSEDQLVLEDYVRPAPEAPAAAPRDRDGKRGLANGPRTGAPPPKKRGRPSKKGGRPPVTVTATATDDEETPWTPEEEQHLQELVDELGEGHWSWPEIAQRLGTGRTAASVERKWNALLAAPDADAGDDTPPNKRHRGAPVKVRTKGGREAIVLEKMQRGWFRVELDQNANDEGGAYERKTLRRPMFAPGQDHLLDAAPQTEVVPKPKGSSSKGRKSVQQTAPGPVPVGAVQAITAGGRVATILERKQRGWFAVELDGDANNEGGAFERKSLRRPEFAPGQDELLDSAPESAGRKEVAAAKAAAGPRPPKPAAKAKKRKLAAPAPSPAPASAAAEEEEPEEAAAPAAPEPVAAPVPARPPLFADGDRVTVVDSCDHGGRSGEIVGNKKAWWKVMLDGDDEAISIRGKDLKRGAPAPPPPPAAARPPPPPPSPPPPPAPPIPPNAFWPGGSFYQPPPGAFGPGPVPLVVAPTSPPDAAEAALAALNGAPPQQWVPPPPAAPGLRLVGGNTPADLAQFFRRSFPGRAADGDTFERVLWTSSSCGRRIFCK